MFVWSCVTTFNHYQICSWNLGQTGLFLLFLSVHWGIGVFYKLIIVVFYMDLKLTGYGQIVAEGSLLQWLFWCRSLKKLLGKCPMGKFGPKGVRFWAGLSHLWSGPMVFSCCQQHVPIWMGLWWVTWGCCGTAQNWLVRLNKYSKF